jgi:predicted regulator of Ras-like GTPase activity (Roadblock/LC7/MglB family)
MAEKDSKRRFTEQVTELLRAFQTSTPGVVGVGLISVDGFTIASEMPESVGDQTVAAMAAAMLVLGEQTTNELHEGQLVRVFVEGTDGYMIIMNAGRESMLSVVARKDAKLGLVFLQMQRTAEGIRAAMS